MKILRVKISRSYLFPLFVLGPIFGLWINLNLRSLPLGVILFFIYFSSNVFLIRKIFFSDEHFVFRTMFSFAVFIALISISGVITYLIYDFSEVPMLVTLATISVLLLLISYKYEPKANCGENNRYRKMAKDSNRKLFHILPFLPIFLCYLLLYMSRSGESLRTPWETINPAFFVSFFLSNFLLIVLIYYRGTKNVWVMLSLIIMLIFIIPSVYLLSLKYPYPERGVATLLAEERKFLTFGKFICGPGDVEKITGIIHKDFTYIACYVLISVFSRFLMIDPYYVNFVIPMFFSLYVPVSAYLLLKFWNSHDESLALIGSLLFLFSQHNVFILVPPTNFETLACAFLPLSIYFWSRFMHEEKRNIKLFVVSLLLTLEILLSHEIVGLYALIAAITAIFLRRLSLFKTPLLVIRRFNPRTFQIVVFRNYSTWHKKEILMFSSFLLLVALSLIPFYLIGNYFVNPRQPILFSPLFNLGEWAEIIFPPIWDDSTLPMFERILYVYLNNFTYYLYPLMLLGLFILYIKKPMCSILISVLVFFSFSSMIIQEFCFPEMGWTREYYRFFYYMNFISFPLLGFGFNSLFKFSLSKSRVKRFLLISIISVILSSCITASLYGGFPRKWSMGPYGDEPKYISDYDIAAVKYIKSRENITFPVSFFIFGDIYTCSAAMLEIGTPKLVKDTTRYMPYSSWLCPNLWSEIKYNPSLKPFEEIAGLTGAKNIYLILTYRIAMDSNEIFSKLLNSYKILLGEPIFEIEGKIYVFLYKEYRETPEAIVIVDDNQTAFWKINRLGQGKIDIRIMDEDKIKFSGLNSLKVSIVEGNYSYFHLYHVYYSAQDWSEKELFVFYWYGAKSGKTFYIAIRSPTVSDYFSYSFIDDFSGWRRFVIPLEAFNKHENASWKNVKEILIIFNPGWSLGSEIYFDRFLLDSRGLEYGDK